MADRNVREILAGIETELRYMRENDGEILKRLSTHSARLDVLEHWRTFLAGAWAVLGGAVYLAWEQIKERVHVGL